MTTMKQFDLELAELKRSIVSMGNLVDRALTIAIEGILHPSADLRERVGAIESQLDMMETAIEDRCHQILALQSPMARDLRLLVSAMRITAELEQVGDLAASIAKRATYIACHQEVRNPPQLQDLARLVAGMINRAMQIFTANQTELAQSLVTEENRSDDLTKQCYVALQDAMAADPGKIKEYTHLLRAVSMLEQVGDLAISITEESVYVHTGALFRHNHDQMPGKG